jgi:hypothetical protein
MPTLAAPAEAALAKENIPSMSKAANQMAAHLNPSRVVWCVTETETIFSPCL